MRVMSADEFVQAVERRQADPTERASPGQVSPRLSWSRLVSEGIVARSEADRGRWRIGELANHVQCHYGSRAMSRFSAEIGEASSTVLRYRWVVRKYPPNVRLRFRDLSFSHFQAVAARPDRLELLERAQRDSWTVERLTRASREGGRRSKEVAPSLHQLVRSVRNLAGQLSTAVTGRAVSPSEATRLDWLRGALDDLATEVQRARQMLAETSPKHVMTVERGEGHAAHRGPLGSSEPARNRTSSSAERGRGAVDVNRDSSPEETGHAARVEVPA